MPLLVFPGFLFPFVTIRAVYFRVLVEIASAMVLYLLLRRELTGAFRRDFVFWSLLAWIAANALAAAFGVAPMRSIFGDHERMGGVWFWIHLFAYYVILRTVLRPEDWWRFFRVAVGVATVVAVYGLVQTWFSPFTFGLGGVGAGSTTGNPGLLAPYLLANVALCAVLAWRARRYASFGYVAIAGLLTVALAFSGNRSSALGLLLGAGVALAFHAVRSGSFRGARFVTAGAFFALAAGLPFVTRAEWARPFASRVPVLGKLSAGVDSSRVVQWRAAVEGIRQRPVLGVGPENYQVVWSEFQHPEMYRFISDSRWDRAHNAYLDALATAGVLGFLSLLAVWMALGWSVTRAAARSMTPGSTPANSRGAIEAIAAGFLVAYAFYLFFWFFDLNSTMLWIAVAAFVASRAAGAPLIEFGVAREKRWQTTMVLAFGAFGLLSVLYVHGFETLRMARTLDHARDSRRPLNEVLADYQSVFSSPAPVTQHALLMYAGRLRDLYPRFQEIRRDPTQADLFARAFVLGITEFERQARQDPMNERILVQHARVLMLGAYYYGDARLYDSALDKLQRAVALSPRRVNTHLVLGVAYLGADRPDLALGAFQRAYAVYPPLGRTHSYIAEAYAALGKHDAAAAWLRSAARQGYTPDRDLVQRVAQALATGGNALAAAELAWDYVRGKAGPAFLWSVGVRRLDPGDARLALAAAEFFLAAGDTARVGVVRAARPEVCVRHAPLPEAAAAAISRTLDRAPTCEEPWRKAGVF